MMKRKGSKLIFVNRMPMFIEKRTYDAVREMAKRHHRSINKELQHAMIAGSRIYFKKHGLKKVV